MLVDACKGSFCLCPPKIEMSSCYQSRSVRFVDISNHQGFREAPGSSGSLAESGRTPLAGARPPGDDGWFWEVLASHSVALCEAGAVPADSSETGCGSADGSIHPDADGGAIQK